MKLDNNKISYIVLGVLAILFIIISFDFGNSGDEHIHVKQAEKVLNFYKTFGEDDRCNTEGATGKSIEEGANIFLYGQSIDTLAAILHRILPFKDIYDTRHMLSALVGLLGIFFTFLIIKEIAGWRAAIIGAAIMLVSPRYIGHIMNNLKDGPFAAFYIMAIWGIIHILKNMPKPTWKQMVAAGVCIGLPLSIRAGGLLLFAYFGMFMGILFLMKSGILGGKKSSPTKTKTKASASKTKGKPAKKVAKKEAEKPAPVKTAAATGPKHDLVSYAKILGITGAVAYIIGIILWPYAIVSPLGNPIKALTEFSNFSTQILQTFDGARIMSNQLPSSYVFQWMWMTIPEVALLGFFISIPLIIIKRKDYNLLFVGLIAFALVFPIAYILYKDSNLYGGWRQVLFVYAPLVILASIGFESLLKMIKSKGGQYAVIGLIGGMCALPLIWMIGNHPHEYVYFNHINGGVKAANGNYELDYYLNSHRVMAKWFRENEMPNLDKSKVTVLKSNKIDNTWTVFEDADKEYIKGRESKYRNRSKEDWDYFIHTNGYVEPAMLRNGTWPPPGCIYSAEAGGVPFGCVLKRVSKEDFYGFQALQGGKPDSAIMHWQKYIALDDKNESVFAGMGQAYMQKGDIEKGYNSLNRALALQPNNPDALNSFLGMALNNVMQQEILNYFLKLANDYPHDFSGNYYLGLFYQNAKDLNNAALYFERAWEASKSQQVFNPMMKIFQQTGNQAKYNQYLEEGRKLGWVR